MPQHALYETGLLWHRRLRNPLLVMYLHLCHALLRVHRRQSQAGRILPIKPSFNSLSTIDADDPRRLTAVRADGGDRNDLPCRTCPPLLAPLALLIPVRASYPLPVQPRRRRTRQVLAADAQPSKPSRERITACRIGHRGGRPLFEPAQPRNRNTRYGSNAASSFEFLPMPGQHAALAFYPNNFASRPGTSHVNMSSGRMATVSKATDDSRRFHAAAARLLMVYARQAHW